VSLRQCIILNPQGSALFAGAVEKNIGYGKIPDIEA
jgi:hypothetical protein